ncbi:protein disulfide oxidoreductase [Arthrobacter sp. PAMC25564]|uniref:NAD(P)H-dependent oxidoreductase subunit E n=1 Tax=Arthrobacter sp. PAMC25564 TaxID=2565366 RepID=UPI0010A23296|nr:NAD(P)H-dependent oxidoreductase subunit E [Arthrobacter sp. PAMC25564]QCB98310.1 protein disulfide oxidoreductase [Arthrobacter sp. PAMC25564]
MHELRARPSGAVAGGRPGRQNDDPFLRYAERFGRPIADVRDMIGAFGAVPADVARSLGLPAAAVEGPASFFADFSAPRGRRHIRVCGAAACFAATGGRHVAEVAAVLGVGAGSRSPDGTVSLQEVRCLGYCFSGPAALDGGEACAGAGLAAQLQGLSPRHAPPIPVHSNSRVPVVTAGLLGTSQPWSVWPEAVASGSSEDVLSQVDSSGLRGRGGAGFRAGAKWRAALARPAPRVVVANGDEGDPGSYSDRLLMERDPHRVLEGLALACFAVRAESGVVFVRSEYPQAFARMQEAAVEARAAGHLGTDIGGSGFTLEIDVVEGAGSYVSGEETALLSGLEGLRGVVRPRPPYPAERGLHGWPTVVNNVETLAAIPWIIKHGAAAYAAMGTPDEAGTVVACLSERFLRPGAYEVEIGTPVRRIVEDLGGGLRDGAVLRALQIGGPLGGFLGPEDLDVEFSDAALSRHGAALGHAGIVAFDDTLAGEDVLRNLWDFAAAESCGQCSPCRVGAWRGRALSDRPDGPDVRGERAHVLRSMAVGSLCAFGRRVPAAVRSLARVYGLAGWPS